MFFPKLALQGHSSHSLVLGGGGGGGLELGTEQEGARLERWLGLDRGGPVCRAVCCRGCGEQIWGRESTGPDVHLGG